MSFVNLVSGGLDSTLIGIMAKEEGLRTYPLFVDYGQRASVKEWETCQAVHRHFDLPNPERMDLAGFGSIITSGLTSSEKDIKLDAFTPGRNLLFLIVGAAYAFQNSVASVSIGLLSEANSLFPDQSRSFIESAEETIKLALGKKIKVVLPLAEFTKGDVVLLAANRGISGTYSCHLGSDEPCGRCISCSELIA